MVERWRQLPLDHALSYSGQVRALVQSLADEVAKVNSTDGCVGEGSSVGAGLVVPDLGPATLMDQLTVMVYDASAAACTLAPVASTSTLAQDLARLRSELR